MMKVNFGHVWGKTCWHTGEKKVIPLSAYIGSTHILISAVSFELGFLARRKEKCQPPPPHCYLLLPRMETPF